MPATPLSERRAVWQSLYASRLPALAKAKDPAQQKWPVTLDHCFGRIILDKVVGEGRVPWTEQIKGPAVRNMSDEQVEGCIELGERIASGDADLVQLDEESLKTRGKNPKAGEKRSREGEVDGAEQSQSQSQEEDSKRRKSDRGEAIKRTSRRTDDEGDIVMASQTQTQNASQASESTTQIDEDVMMASQSQPQSQGSSRDQKLAAKTQNTDSMAEERRLIESSSLADYRKRVLLALCQVPKGKYTTYAAISEFLKSSPRAVGNAMRNNPFAPAVPCHRVLAADGKIGGYCGQWGEGDLIKKKRSLLREEGLRFDGTGKVVGGPWKGFK